MNGAPRTISSFFRITTAAQPRRLTDGKSRNMGPKWSPSGDLLAWSSNARNSRDMDLYIAAPSDPHFVRMFKEVSGQWTVADWSPDETRIAGVEYISINESYIHIVEIATGKTQTIAPRGAIPRPNQSPRVIHNGQRMAARFITSPTRVANSVPLVREDLASGEIRVADGHDFVGRRGVRSQ